jgi:hypothetical protein
MGQAPTVPGHRQKEKAGISPGLSTFARRWT